MTGPRTLDSGLRTPDFLKFPVRFSDEFVVFAPDL